MALLTYEIDGDTVTIDQAKKVELNVMAARFYKRCGYEVKDGFDFSKSKHPQEITMWDMAVDAYFMQLTSGIFD